MATCLQRQVLDCSCVAQYGGCSKYVLGSPQRARAQRGVQILESICCVVPKFNRLRKTSKFLNSRHKIKAFEALWAVNIMAARDVWMAHKSLPKKRENAKVQSNLWKVCSRMAIGKSSLHLSFGRSFMCLCLESNIVSHAIFL